MKASTMRLLDFLGQPQDFTIPAYQRVYSWRERQCRELWRDIERAARQERTHFLGTVLYAPDQDGRCSIIDGQQRLTTIVLMLTALAQWLDDQGRALDDAGGVLGEAGGALGSEALRRRFLLNDVARDEPPVCKLTLSAGDAATLQAVVTDTAQPADSSRTILENLALFRSLMDADDFDIDALWRGLSALTIIAVEVENALSVQSYFESLNSKGLPLNVADLARNYLLLSENHEEQTRLYQEYWAAMEEIYHPDPGSKRLDSGIRAWLSIRLRTTKILTVEQSYSEFKRYVEDKFHGEKESILAELRSFSLMWAENFRYHGVKKFKSSHDWAINGAPILTAGRPLVNPPGPEYFENLRKQRDTIRDYW